jgi:hypothetical protein
MIIQLIGKTKNTHPINKCAKVIFFMCFFSIISACNSTYVSKEISYNVTPLHVDSTYSARPPAIDSLAEPADDYMSVVAGRPPIHAKFDDDAPLPADGGTDYYKGHGYKLTIQQSLVNVPAGILFLYGPIIEFENSLMSGNSNKISNIQIYSPEALRILRGQQPHS